MGERKDDEIEITMEALRARAREEVLWKSLQEAADELIVLEARFPMWLKRAPECAPVLELVRVALEDLSQAINRGLAS